MNHPTDCTCVYCKADRLIKQIDELKAKLQNRLADDVCDCPPEMHWITDQNNRCVNCRKLRPQ